MSLAYVLVVLRYAHVQGHHVDQAIAVIRRTPLKLDANKDGGAVTRELHKPELRSV